MKVVERQVGIEIQPMTWFLPLVVEEFLAPSVGAVFERHDTPWGGLGPRKAQSTMIRSSGLPERKREAVALGIWGMICAVPSRPFRVGEREMEESVKTLMSRKTAQWVDFLTEMGVETDPILESGSPIANR